MDFFIQNGVNWVVAIQSLGTWLKVPMLAFSFLGTENFFLLVLPLIYWCIDARLGLQVGFILLTSVHVNSLFKLWFAGPRPYWVSSRVTPYLAEETFGIPSGHAQNSVGVWGMIASGIRKPWAWALAVALAFCIGFSRLYLGVHFPHDVVMGWFLGSVLLWLFLRFWVPVEAWLKPKSLNTQVLIALVVSILFIGSGAVSVGRLAGYTLATEWQDNALRAGTLPAPVSIEGFITSAGTFFGLAAGIAWLAARGGYQAEGSTQQRALRFVVGVIGILILWRGLALFLPDNADLISYIFRYLRYSLVGFWVSAGAPWLFFRFKLAQSQM